MKRALLLSIVTACLSVPGMGADAPPATKPTTTPTTATPATNPVAAAPTTLPTTNPSMLSPTVNSPGGAADAAAATPTTRQVLVIVSAQWGVGQRWLDVTDEVQKHVKDGRLDMRVKYTAFASDPAPGVHKHLEVIYEVNGERHTASFEHDTQARLTPETAVASPRRAPTPPRENDVEKKPDVRKTSAARKGDDLGLSAKAEQLRKRVGDGLIILDAQFGSGNRWKDVTDRLQAKVRGNGLMMRSAVEEWGDPAAGSVKSVKVAYWDGSEVKHAEFGDGELISIEGFRPAALAALAPFPAFVVEGQDISHAFGGTGTYVLKSGPAGMSIAADGVVRWTPTPEQAGGQEFKFTYAEGNKEYLDTRWCEVLGKATAAPAGGDPKNLDAIMRLPLQDAKGAVYAPNLEFKDSLVADGNRLIVTGPDGIAPVKTLELEHAYLRVGERKEYYLGVRAQAEDLIDKQTGKVIKTIPFPYKELQDVAFKPHDDFTLIAVRARMEVPRDQVLVVRESTGEVKAPKDFVGSYLQFDASGKHLWIGVKDLFTSGSKFYINPDWSIIEMPSYGNIDMLFRVDMNGGQVGVREKILRAGGNGFGLRVAPDGSRVSYLSFSGFPDGSKTAPAWDAMDFTKLPVVYDMHGVNGDGGPRNLAFHPVLPLVAIARPGGVTIFARDTGTEDVAHVKFSAGALAATNVVDAQFSADGMNLILRCKKDEKSWLYKVPLVLTAQELQTLASPPAAREPGPVRAPTPAPARPLPPRNGAE